MGILGNMFSGDNLYRIGAALKDIGDGSSENLTAAEKMLAGRAAQQRKAQGLAQLQQILAGQTQPLNAGNPSVESMVAGQMTGAEGAPSLAQVTARPMPKMPSLRDGRTPAQLLALAASNPDEVGLAMKMMEANAPHVKVGPDGTTYDEGDPGALNRTFANPTNINGWIKDVNDPKNRNAYVPKIDDGAVPLFDGAGNVVAQRLLDGTIQNRAALAGAEAGAKAAGEAPYEFINVPTASGAPQTMSRAQAVGGVFTGQSPAEAIRAEGQARGEVDRATSLQARAATAGRQLSALDTMEDLLPDVIAGFGADMKLQAARAMAATGNEDATRKVKATETFINQGRVLVADMIKTFGANPTEGERKYAERMSGADAQLNPETLREGIRLQRARINRDLQEAGAARDNAAAPAPTASRPSGGARSGYSVVGVRRGGQ